jgi:hypothetical protein
MADKRCENGHFIDEAWDICPYCPPPSRTAGDVSVVRPRRVEDDYRHRRADSEGHRAQSDSGPLRAVAPESPAPPQRTVAVPKMESGPFPSRRYVVGFLLGLTGPIRGEAYPVRMGKNIIGRDRKSDIVVDDEQASAYHADLVFRPEEQRFILMDHNSTNGTYVNGVEIEPRKNLEDRDVIRIGLQRFMFLNLFKAGFNWDDQDAK